MCGRFSLTIEADGVEVLYSAKWQDDTIRSAWKPKFNISPGQYVPVVVAAPASVSGCKRVIKQMRWGLVPSWAPDEIIGTKLMNVRSETIDTKPSFKAAFQSRRCLIPADGFYEWSSTKVPYRICTSDIKPFALAGIWERWKNPQGEILETFSIVTKDASSQISHIHSRMPVILKEEDFDFWLNEKELDMSRLKRLLLQEFDEKLLSYAVSKLVNSAKVNDPRCILAAGEVTLEESLAQQKYDEKEARDDHQMSFNL